VIEWYLLILLSFVRDVLDKIAYFISDPGWGN